MPNILIRGHMRFEDSESDGDGDHVDVKRENMKLKKQITERENELILLRNEYDNVLTNETKLTKDIEKLQKRVKLVGNRRAKRDSLVNAALTFEDKLSKNGKPGYIDLERQSMTEKETIIHIHNELMNMMSLAQDIYPNITLENILRK